MMHILPFACIFFSIIFSSERQDMAKLSQIFLAESRNSYNITVQRFEGWWQVMWNVSYGAPRTSPLIISCLILLPRPSFRLIENSYFVRVLHLCNSYVIHTSFTHLIIYILDHIDFIKEVERKKEKWKKQSIKIMVLNKGSSCIVTLGWKDSYMIKDSNCF